MLSIQYFRHLMTIANLPDQRKHIRRWLKSLQKDYLLNNGIPWITYDAVDFIKNCFPKNAKVFEYGSGGSTLFWLRHNSICVSVEHDSTWFNVIQKRLSNHKNIDYRLVQPEKSNEPFGNQDPADPELYLSSDPQFIGYNFKKYVCQIDTFPDNYFDIIFIDGRARPSCIMHSIQKLSRKGTLILDNSEVVHYKDKTMKFLKNFDSKVFLGVLPIVPHMSETTIYIKRN
ncbi:MAG: hypothetical protein A3D10_09250 [Omnitrophica WOR_2 bacterium RIFCSPHIGHO2_02_FULL_48_11]|nr:MAG: hypothetical protein A3D10_09250 [Omnitrophica WOR_2 bacterium RIFCSPHIGHO2_02_FULL_48_11]